MDGPATEPRLASDQHDLVLALALGALSAALRFEKAVTVPSPQPTSLDPDDPVVLAALGALGLTRALRRWLEAAAEPGRATARAPLPDPISPRELLR